MALAVPRIAYSLAEVEALSGLSRSTLYRLMARGELETVKLGRRRLVPAKQLEKLGGARQTEGNDGRTAKHT